MKLDYLTAVGKITRPLGSEDERSLTAMYDSGLGICGIVDQFPWMPFVVVERVVKLDKVTFQLKMVAK